jgi:hypothetical protein
VSRRSINRLAIAVAALLVAVAVGVMLGLDGGMP